MIKLNLFLEDAGRLPEWTYILIIPVFLIVGLAIVAFIIRITKVIKLNKKFKGKQNVTINTELVDAYGGTDNIVSISKEMTRLSVNVKDLDKVNPEAIKALGAKNVLIVGNDIKSTFEDIDSAYLSVGGR